MKSCTSRKTQAVALAIACIFLSAAALAADLTGSNVITTAAGAAWIFRGDGLPGVTAPLSPVTFLSTDTNGNVIFADTGNHVVSRINADGTITVLAGNGLRGFSGDGRLARSASLDSPFSAVMDGSGNLYIYDGNARIRRVTPNGIISTFAGTGTPGADGDGGPATSAAIESQGALALDTAGFLYFTQP